MKTASEITRTLFAEGGLLSSHNLEVVQSEGAQFVRQSEDGYKLLTNQKRVGKTTQRVGAAPR